MPTDGADRPDDDGNDRDVRDTGGDPDATDDATDSDADGGTSVACGTHGYVRKDIALFEPCLHPSPEVDGTCSYLEPAYGPSGSCSSWQRVDEPLEIPLRNGIIDDSVTAYFTFDQISISITGNVDIVGIIDCNIIDLIMIVSSVLIDPN